MTESFPQTDREQGDSSVYRNHFYHSGDDRLTLYARIYDGDGPSLLLMHGLTRNSADFEGLATHLAGRYRLIIPDQRGRGRSDYDPEPANYTPTTYVGDMLALMASLQLDQVGLIGTSMGGIMAMMMAASDPERFHSLILNDIGPVVEQIGLDRIQSYVRALEPFENWQQAANHCRKVHGDMLIGYDDKDWLSFARRVCQELPDGQIKYAYDPAISEGLSGTQQTAVPLDLWPIWDQFANIPTLIIYGALTDIISPSTITEMQRRHSGPISAVEIANRGHAPMLDEPAVLSAIDPFLKNIAP
ncbi:alpha/beta fold hydrolase [Parasphingorhabdus cellanae]|uniref:Alpha/beta hydrolase n=1 Tax=Parasphingorhabdus cellanae TaxID=2806553 RepID=A0ABX7T6E3_9SPHN|nr:alpha/beta hydrolase [Parasphingorhabdus cellanae]QTD55785.1 alpha/beta hydrolase [Parasphingorhabdus cellanae]